MGIETLAEKVARLRAERLGDEPDAAGIFAFDPDLIPDISPAVRSKEDDDIDRLLDGVDIVDAYVRWCGKMQPVTGSKTESIMASCPKPEHPDSHPSAWLNSQKGTWFCGGCQEGGDVYDIAGYHFGFDVPGYKTNGTFPDLRRRMAEDLGYVIKRTPTGTEYIETPDTDDDSTVDEVSEDESDDPDDFDYDRFTQEIEIEWKRLLPGDTFMRRWMDVVSVDDLPEEYYFWLGLMAVGLAVGNDAVLNDNPIVRGNLFVALFGPTGIGKSRSTNAFRSLLRQALPYDHDDPTSKGVMLVPVPGSAEAMVDSFSKPEYDPSAPTKVIGYNAVRGVVRFDEFSSLTERANRAGSTLKSTLMELYDGYDTIELKARGAGYARAEDHFCSAITTTQPKAIKELVSRSDAESGFLNRWVFAAGKIKPLISFGRADMDFDSLVEPLRAIRAWASSGRIVTPDRAALELWERFFRKDIEPFRISVDHPLLTRIDLVMKKLMLLYAADAHSEVVTEEMMARTISLFPYLQITYGLLDSKLNATGPFGECQSAIKKAVEMHGPITIRDIDKRLNQKFARDLMLKAVKTLVDFKIITEEVGTNTRGPKTVRYSYVAD